MRVKSGIQTKFTTHERTNKQKPKVKKGVRKENDHLVNYKKQSPTPCCFSPKRFNLSEVI